MKALQIKSFIDEMYNDVPTLKILNDVFKCEYVFILLYDKSWNSIVERVRRSSKETELIDFKPCLIGPELVKSVLDAPRFLNNQEIEKMGLKANFSVMIASIGESEFFRGAVAVAKSKATWGKPDLEKFYKVLSLIIRIYDLNIELEENKIYTDTIVESLGTAILAVSQNGIMIHFNKAAERLYGIPASEAIGKHYNELSSSKVLKLTKSTFDYVMRTGNPWIGNLIEFTRLDNKIILISPSFYPWYDGDDKRMGVISIVRDETGANALQEQLVKSEKLTILGKLASKVSANVNEPLITIKSMANMIGNNANSKINYDYIKTIIEQADRIDATVKELLASSKPEEKYDLNDINQVLKNSLKMSKINESELKVVQKYSHNLFPIKCDPKILEQIFVNILNNAYEALDKEHGKISIITYRSPVESIHVKVIDNGCGIPEQLLDKIFEPYFTNKDVGVGLGLSIVQKNVKTLGGKIKITSDTGKGTCFEIEFPLERNNLDGR